MNKIKSITILLAVALILSVSGCVSTYSNDKYYFEMAVNTNNESYCEKVTSKFVPDRTSYLIKGFTTTEDGRIILEYSREECYKFLAQNKNDVEICKKLPNYKNKINLCIRDVAKFNKDVKPCEMMMGEDKDYFRRHCYRESGIILKNPDYCLFERENLDSGERGEARNCIREIAKQTEDLQEALSICGLLDYQSYREDCYQDVAVVNKDKSICEKIVNEEDKKMCIDVIDSLIQLHEKLPSK